MQEFFEGLTSHIRLADLLDIGVIALLLYGGLSWFRQRASRSLAIGLALIVGLYLVARSLDMYLTTTLFQAGFTAALLALIVIFQQDLRRAFERLAATDMFGVSRSTQPASNVLDTLVESLCTLADARIGALLVFEGREPLERHIRGGVVVDGRISLPLIASIFNPESSGHDGAVLICGERIEKLGVHLPLSKNISQIGQRGTRHASALGLAECCDALVLVVSEERGSISIAEHGQLREINHSELKPELERCYRERSSPRSQESWYRVPVRHAGSKIAALSVACILWLLFAYRVETLERTVDVPIEYRGVPENWSIDEPRPSRAELTLSGSERAFNMLDPDSLSVSFDVSNLHPKGQPHVLKTEASVMQVPAELEVHSIWPRQVEIQMRPKTPDDS